MTLMTMYERIQGIMYSLDGHDAASFYVDTPLNRIAALSMVPET